MNLQRILKQLFHQNQFVRRTPLLSVGALALALTAKAQPHQIGLKMGMNGNGGLQNTATGALQPTDIAGPLGLSQANWNDLGRYGSNGTNIYAVTNGGTVTVVATTNSFPIFDSNGDDTHVTVHWDASGSWSQVGGGTPTDQGLPDANLMNGYCDSGGNANVALTQNSNIYSQNNNNKPLVFIEGLQGWLATQAATAYDVVVYADGDATSARTGEYWIQAASCTDTTGPLTNIVFGTDLTTHGFICDRANFTSTFTYTEEPLTSTLNWIPTVPGFGGGDAGWGAVLGNSAGNYVVFRDLTADSFVLRTEELYGAGGTRRSPINAIQIIPRTAPVPPEIAPLSDCQVYAGGTAVFRATVAGVLPITYQWQKGGVDLTDGGNISGATTPVLTITGVGAGDGGTYTLNVNDANGSASVSAPLSLVTYAGNSFAEEIVTNNPVAYWRLNDVVDPSTNNAPAHDYIGGLNGIYGTSAQDGYWGIVGPQPPAFPGFESGNAALQSANGIIRSWVVAPPLNLNTNTATLCAWVYPTGNEPGYTGILFSRTTNNDACGLGIGGTANHIGYNWNNQSGAWGFDSRITIPSNTWSFVGVVIRPEDATLFVYNTNGLFSVTNSVTNAVAGLTGLTCIGDDPSSANTPQGRAFNGMIDEVAVFNHALPPIEVYNLYKKALHQGAFPPTIVSQPISEVLYAGRPAMFTVQASGDPFLALSYQWRKGGVNLTDGGNISGATTPTLSVSDVSAADEGSYDVVVVNLAGSATSAPATLQVVTPPASFTAYESELQALGPDHYWRFNESSGSSVAYDYWGGIVANNFNVLNGGPGPVPPDFPGFQSTNTANHYDGFTGYTDTGAKLTPNLPAFTILGWFNTDGPIGTRIGLFGENDVTEFGFHGDDPYAGTGFGELGIWTAGGGSTYLSQTNITPGQWYLTAATGDGTNLSLYLFTTNGSGGAQLAFSSVTAPTTNYGVGSGDPFRIGGGGILDPGSNYFTGTIDEVGVFHRALSGGELSSLFATAIGTAGLPPQIMTQPISEGLYAGRTATFTVLAVGSAPLSYQWLKNGNPVTDANASGADTATLTISNVAAANDADYTVVITNSAGSATSSAATLMVITPVAGGYESEIIALNPLAYYRLNETTDPSTGTAVANDFWGGHPGTYGEFSLNGFNNIAGPRPPTYTGFDATNYALETAGGTNSGSAVINNFGTLNTNTATFTMWLFPTAAQDSYCGLEINRGGSNPAGFGYTGGHLGYTWNNNSGATWGATWTANLVPPTNQWSFVALVVTPTNAIVYMTDPANPANLLSATATVNNVVESHGGTWHLGTDPDGSTRTFAGSIDEVAVFDYSMTAAQIQELNVAGYAGAPVTLQVQQSGSNLILTWPNGVLQSADQASGPYTEVSGATSGYQVPTDAPQKYYRVKVR